METQVDRDNQARAAIEFYDIMATRPSRIIAYMGTDAVTGWMGNVFGHVIGKGAVVRQGGFTSTHRQYVRVKLVNGETYGGWSQGTGVYIKLRKVHGK